MRPLKRPRAVKKRAPDAAQLRRQARMELARRAIAEAGISLPREVTMGDVVNILGSSPNSFLNPAAPAVAASLEAIGRYPKNGKSCAKELRRLAGRLEREMLPLLDAALRSWPGFAEMIPDPKRLLGEMRALADLLWLPAGAPDSEYRDDQEIFRERLLSLSPRFRARRGPQRKVFARNLKLGLLVELMKLKTGKPHYRLVGDIANAAMGTQLASDDVKKACDRFASIPNLALIQNLLA